MKIASLLFLLSLFVGFAKAQAQQKEATSLKIWPELEKVNPDMAGTNAVDMPTVDFPSNAKILVWWPRNYNYNMPNLLEPEQERLEGVTVLPEKRQEDNKQG